MAAALRWCARDLHRDVVWRRAASGLSEHCRQASSARPKVMVQSGAVTGWRCLHRHDNVVPSCGGDKVLGVAGKQSQSTVTKLLHIPYGSCNDIVNSVLHTDEYSSTVSLNLSSESPNKSLSSNRASNSNISCASSNTVLLPRTCPLRGPKPSPANTCSRASSVANSCSVRLLSTSSTYCAANTRNAGLNVFDRHTKLLQRERAAGKEDADLYDYLKEEVGFRLADRIFDIKREFEVGLDLGCGRGNLSKHITNASMKKLVMGEFSPLLLASAHTPACPGLSVEKVALDEEHPLPFDDNSLDVVLSNLSLHWVNNLPGCLREVQRCLRPDGAVLAAMFGGDTLYQLRSALLLAEMERLGGMSPHVSPFTEVQDIGGLLNQSGFTLLTIDTEVITVGYPSMFELMWDLQGMAENNANASRKLHLPRDTLMAAAAIYQEMYGLDEGIPATFQIIYMIGWKPNPDKIVKPAARGSGQVSFKDISRLDELVKEKGMEGRIKFMEEIVDKDK